MEDDMQTAEGSRVSYNTGTTPDKHAAIDEPDRRIIEHLAGNIATALVKNAGSNFRVLIIVYAILAITIVLILKSVTLDIVAPAVAIGLALVLFVDRLERKKLFKRFYQQEVSSMRNIIHLVDEQQNSPTVVAGTVYALAAAVDAKDHYTYGHSRKVATYVVDIAEELGYSSDGINRIYEAALLHDIGKIGIPEQVLTKQGPLSTEEWNLMRSHPDKGIAILKYVNSLNGCLECVRYHHEHYDGAGYPKGLKGENIPFDARILAVADAYDAMTSERPYRPTSKTLEQALVELKRCAGKQFDPRVVKAFVASTKSHSPSH